MLVSKTSHSQVFNKNPARGNWLPISFEWEACTNWRLLNSFLVGNPCPKWGAMDVLRLLGISVDNATNQSRSVLSKRTNIESKVGDIIWKGSISGKHNPWGIPSFTHFVLGVSTQLPPNFLPSLSDCFEITAISAIDQFGFEKNLGRRVPNIFQVKIHGKRRMGTVINSAGRNNSLDSNPRSLIGLPLGFHFAQLPLYCKQLADTNTNQ